MNSINLEELQKKWSEGGKKGGSAKGKSKKRSAEHYRLAGIKSGEARRAKKLKISTST